MPEEGVPYKQIAQDLARGWAIPFLGAGASLGDRPEATEPPKPPVWEKGRSPFLPTGSELAVHLAGMSGLGADSGRDLAAIAEYHAVKAAGRDALNRELHEIFDSDYELTPVHRMLAMVKRPQLIVTTNYDDLVERALAGRHYDLVVHRIDCKQLYWRPYGAAEQDKVSGKALAVDLNERTVVYKIHGTVFRGDAERDQYVITEGDYLEFVGRMSRKTPVPGPINEAFRRRPFLFLGYSLRDWNIRIILNRLQRHLKGRLHTDVRSWAIVRDPSKLDAELWDKRGVNVHDVELSEFVEGVLAEWPDR